MTITTLCRAVGPNERASICLVERQAQNSYAVVVDVRDHYATFETFPDIFAAIQCLSDSAGLVLDVRVAPPQTAKLRGCLK